MHLPAFSRQPESAAAWFASAAGHMLIASEVGLLHAAAIERPGQPCLWLQPSGIDMGNVEQVALPGLRLHASADGFAGDVRCRTPLPLANESCGLVLVQHLADFITQPGGLLAECARVLVPGGRLWLVALNPLSPYRLRWRGQGPRAAEPVSWRRRLRAVGLMPEAVSQGIGPTWRIAINAQLQEGAGVRAAFLLRAEKRRIPLTPTRAPHPLRMQTGVPAA